MITVKEGWAVQSFGYSRYLPLGKPERLAENLDRWGADEILVLCIDRSADRSNDRSARDGEAQTRARGPDIALLKSLNGLGLSTPLAYGGGVHNVEDAAAVIQTGAERVCLDAALHEPQVVRDIAGFIGAQAVIAALPLSVERGEVRRYDYRSRQSAPLSAGELALFADGTVSEALVIDWRHEGQRASFDESLVTSFPIADVPLIVFGGISEPSQLASLLEMPRVAAAAVGNFLSYSEHALQTLKHSIVSAPLRAPVYATDD